MNTTTLRRSLIGAMAWYYCLMVMLTCRAQEVAVSFDQLWPQGRVAQVLQLSKKLLRCAQEIQAGNLTSEERVDKMRELLHITKVFGDRVCLLDYEGLKEDEYLYIYTIAKQALQVYSMLQEST